MSDHESENDNNSVLNYNKLTWNASIEKLFRSWCDIARCYKWLHEKSYHKYRKINYAFAIPIIVLSTLTGTANIGINGLVPPESTAFANLVIGLVSIITGVIGTLQSFFRYPQLSEAHLNAYTGWSRFERLISTELNLERKARRNTGDFLKICRNEYERLMEQSPLIPPEITREFTQKFGAKNMMMLLPDTLEDIKPTHIFVDSDEEDFENLMENETIREKFNKRIEEVVASRQKMEEAKTELRRKLETPNTRRPSYMDIPTNFVDRIPSNERPHRRMTPPPTPIEMPSDIKINVRNLISKMEENDVIKKKYAVEPAPFSVVENSSEKN
jgi:hypothetical protein